MTNLKGKTILIVDDEESVREGVAAGLERQGCKTLQAGSGHEALKLIESNSIDAVVTDVRMPNGTGIELLEWIRSRNLDVPVTFIMTGFSDVSEPELYDKGAEAVFQKPFQRKALHAALERLLTPPSVRWSPKPGDENPKVQVTLKLQDLAAAVGGQLIEIGRGGMFVGIEGEIPVRGDVVSFSIKSPQGPVLLLEGKGVVRWTRLQPENGHAGGCGVEFLELSESCRSNVSSWIENLRLKPYIPIT